MRRSVVFGMVVIWAVGCGGRTSSLLLERHAVGPLTDISDIGQAVVWRLEPVTQTHEQGKVEVTVTFASDTYLKELFSDKKVFKEFAGLNPYFPENLVFYIKVANRSDRRVRINPAEFILVDDHGNQYAPLNVDYVTALEDARRPMATTTREMLQDARPGYFGLSFPIGKLVAQKPQQRFALIKQSSLQGGFIYPGVVHDGLVAFWSPMRQAKTLRLLLANVKTDFDATELPQTNLEFPFTFQAGP
ncbi:MAG: hypothetical protein Q8R91_02635 [Candidatus Omnitrophota bacterium]|nr:hypothetical protein [Candidatus Omnitrophota bacterium]